MRDPGKNFLLLCIALIWANSALAIVLPRRDKVLENARFMLDNWAISYVYGGHKVGNLEACGQCNSCLDQKKPVPKQRLAACPACSHCSLDCSHFLYELFKRSGLGVNYLTTATMNDLSPEKLVSQFNLLDVGQDLNRALPGDLLVYDGHVILLERRGTESGRGDIIHVTSGREIKGGGQAIQRERNASLAQFRGRLLRILRHLDLAKELRDAYLERRALAPAAK